MTSLEILTLVSAGMDQIMKLVRLAQQIQSGEIAPDTIKPEDLRFPTAEEILGDLRRPTGGPPA